MCPIFGRAFFCNRPPSVKKDSMLEGKSVILANHNFETPTVRPEVGTENKRKWSSWHCVDAWLVSQPFKLKIKQMPKCWSHPVWRWCVNECNDHPQCNCLHALALHAGEKKHAKIEKPNVEGWHLHDVTHKSYTSMGLLFTSKLGVKPSVA